MAINPFEQKAGTVDSCLLDWKNLNSKPYNKNSIDPYTKIRIILANGAEFEANWFMHQLSRHCDNNDLRCEVALMRRVEQQQQKRIASLKPLNETVLETTIGYEMLAVDLTSALAKNEKNPDVKKALDFALLEDFDHLYRYADLLEGERGIKAEKLVGKHVEVMPGRPTIAHHRHPHDEIRRSISADDSLATKVHVGIIVAAEQQTMNYYMNVGSFHDTEAGRKLYAEIAMVEEAHVTHYGSLMDPHTTWLECLLMHEYTECYLYYSNYKTETNPAVKALWEQLYAQELTHLHKAAELLQTYEKKDWQQVIPNAAFPKALTLEPSVEYVRKVLATARVTTCGEDYARVDDLPDDANFFCYQNTVNANLPDVMSHRVIKNYAAKNGQDYRWQTKPHPIPELDDRKKDNFEVGCKKNA